MIHKYCYFFILQFLVTDIISEKILSWVTLVNDYIDTMEVQFSVRCQGSISYKPQTGKQLVVVAVVNDAYSKNYVSWIAPNIPKDNMPANMSEV